MNTIFPFVVERRDGSSYVELPYTLGQDSTMFLVLRESTTDLWKRKVDWIARHGGMALVIVHPDYMSFGNTKAVAEYRAELYEEFLRYVREQYGDCAWFALPREVASHVRHNTKPLLAPPRTAAHFDHFERSA